MTTDSETGDDPARLLAAYEAGSSFFCSSPRATMLARGVEATVPKVSCSARRSDLPARVAEFLRGAEDFGRRDPIVVGAVPFDEDLPAHLVMPTEVCRAGPLPISVRGSTKSGLGDSTVREVPSPAEFERGVARALRRLESGDVDKVVLARSLEVTAASPVDVGALLRRLAESDPGVHAFAVDLPRRGEDGSRDSFGPTPVLGRTLVGASPELLVSRTGTRVRSQPMAGSLARSSDPVEDRRRAETLLRSAKDLREHAFVVDAAAESLAPWCTDLDVPDTPALVSTANMWHLSTEITGELRDPDTSSLELAMAMHPTPAVCGTPVDAARAIIDEVEPFDRGYYAGVVGWSDARGDGEWVVALRCAEVEDDSLRLHAGAGVVVGSEPASELAETTAKFRTALAAMGIDPLHE
jgi:isochorismate synthase